MIQPLRTVHRRAFIVLAGLLPAIILGGLNMRHHNIAVASPASGVPQHLERIGSVSAVWEKNTLATEFYSDTAHQLKLRLLLNPARELPDADLLLYSTTNAGSTSDDLSHASLVGPFVAGKAYSVPQNEVAGYLILYSLAHRTIVDRAKVDGLP